MTEPAQNKRINSREGLLALLGAPYAPGLIEIELPGLSAGENAAWAARLNQSYHECGCGISTAVLLSGLLVTGIFFVFLYPALTSWVSVSLSAFGVFILSGLAKVMSKRMAHKRFARYVSYLAEEPGQANREITCG